MSITSRTLILAPSGQDGDLVVEVLAEAGLAALPCADLDALCAGIAEGAGVVVIAEEAVSADAAQTLANLLTAEPAWSILPFVLLTSAPALDVDIVALFGERALVTVLERPCSALALVSAVRTALYARARQYEMRALVQRLEAQAQELERSNRDLDRFASCAAHDLQEPLRTVASYLGLVERRIGAGLDDPTLRYIRTAIDGAARMDGMIRALLQFAAVGEGRIAHVPFPAGEAAREALQGLAMAVADAAAEVTVEELPTVVADRALITQLLQNLLANAIKFRRGPPRIRVHGGDDGRQWMLAVSDDGCGISAGDAERIFRPFERAGDGRHAGFGIGLATCRRIAEAHRGGIRVESTPGVGSTFVVTLPKPDLG